MLLAGFKQKSEMIRFTFEEMLAVALRIGWRGQVWKQGHCEELVITQVRGAGGSQQMLEAGEQGVEFRHPWMVEQSGSADRIIGSGCIK